jgi:hypothetical protein
MARLCRAIRFIVTKFEGEALALAFAFALKLQNVETLTL